MEHLHSEDPQGMAMERLAMAHQAQDMAMEPQDMAMGKGFDLISHKI